MPEDRVGVARRRVVGGRAVPRVLVAVALTAGSLGLPATARAGAAPESPLAAAAPFAPCGPAGVASADKKLAERLRPLMSGRRLGRSVTGAGIACARAIVGNVKGRGLDQRAAVIALTTAIAESSLRNYAVAVDHDSLGLFQQRPSQGWGLPGQLLDPGYATHAFLAAMIRKHPGGAWMTGDIGQICQRVQGSAYPAAYAPEVPDAHLLVTALWPQVSAPSVAVRSMTAPAAAPARAKGPFQRTLAATATGLVPLDARHDVSTADWNGDRRADLVVVQGTGTTSGRTELRIMDGASSFQPQLLHTATVLGPTDDRHALSLQDWNGDKRLDLVVVQKSGTASGRTELRVVDGASSFQRFLVETVTMLGPTDERHAVQLTDWNGDGRPDLVLVEKAGTASGRTELRVVDGASDFQRLLAHTPTALGPTDKRHELSLAHWNADRRLDLVIVQKSGTASRKTDVRVLDGAANFRRSLLQARSAQNATDDRHDVSVTDWNGDGRLDLLVVQKSGAASGWTEARVLAG